MRYIGNKENILDKIYSILEENHISGKSFFDFFAGTTNVSRFFKSKGYRVFSSDILYLSYCLQKAYIENNNEPLFSSLLPSLPVQHCDSLFSRPLSDVVNYLNSLLPVEGFIYKNYTPGGTRDLERPRTYFIDDNGGRIDAIRMKIEEWKTNGLINESEYYILLACLIETIGFYSNIAGVYAAFQKHWDPRALKPLELKTIELIDNKLDNKVYCADSMDLIEDINVDVLYLDPPYNERQYAPNYHILETIAKYDNPCVRGVTGMRDYSGQKSRFCRANTALDDLDKIAKTAKFKYLVLSYNSEGIMPQDKIVETLRKYGEVKLEQFEYARFKSNNNGLAKTKKTVFEQLYILEKKNNMNLWILTEERPKVEVLQMIFEYFAKDQRCGFFGDSIRIIPILNPNKTFSFTYEVIGFKCAKVDHVFIKTVSGSSSFTDFLIFYQEKQPIVSDTPLYAIEETKTDDKESRNTGVYQRCSKFVFIQNFYQKTKLIMLYALQVGQKAEPTETYIFGTRMLMTLGVEILGKVLDPKVFKPFTSIDELIESKASMRKAPAGNVPISITKVDDNLIQVSGRLYKSGGLSHDPNIGALSIICAVLRKLGWKGSIVITRHGLQQSHVGTNNKFVQIANVLRIELDGLIVPHATLPNNYWHYEIQGEKLGTIFIHICVENFTTGYSIFENHAGCEKGYFLTPTGDHIALEKYSDRDAYKAGDKDAIVFIPDLVLLDVDEAEVITIEGKKYANKRKGIEELNNYNSFDKKYLKKYYPKFKIVRTVVLYGSNNEFEFDVQVGFLLNERGKLVLGVRAPRLFAKAIGNLLNYWN